MFYNDQTIKLVLMYNIICLLNRKVYESQEGDKYRVPDYLLLIGQMVVAMFPEDNNWHRCVITNLSVKNYVEVSVLVAA